jgi:hypothetical protein
MTLPCQDEEVDERLDRVDPVVAPSGRLFTAE